MVYGFIKQSNGHIKIYSEVGHGTTVKLYLPRSEASAVVEAPAPALVLNSPDNETVLVVEDEAMVRDFVVQQLRQLGYRTLLAENGKEALAVLDGDSTIDLLLTDVILSGTLTGKQVADAAAQRRSGDPASRCCSCPAIPRMRSCITAGSTPASCCYRSRSAPPNSRGWFARRLQATIPSTRDTAARASCCRHPA